jgi:hypothetical protein
MHGYRPVDAFPPWPEYRRKKLSTRSAASTARSGSQSVITWPSPSYTASWTVRPRRLSPTNNFSASWDLLIRPLDAGVQASRRGRPAEFKEAA